MTIRVTTAKSATDSWMDMAGRYPLLCETDTLRLIRKLQDPEQSDKARRRALDRLCLANLRLVVSTVQKTVQKSAAIKWHDEIVADLFQQGYLGLRRAAEKFDTKKKIRFSTYASIWINQSVGRFKAAQSTLFKMPEKVMFEVWNWKKTGKMRTDGKEVLSPQNHQLAANALYATSLDAVVKESETEAGDFISYENSLWAHTDSNIDEVRQHVQDLLRIAKVEPKVQQMFLDYMRRGNLQSACRKVAIRQGAARKLINETIEKLQAIA